MLLEEKSRSSPASRGWQRGSWGSSPAGGQQWRCSGKKLIGLISLTPEKETFSSPRTSAPIATSLMNNLLMPTNCAKQKTLTRYNKILS